MNNEMDELRKILDLFDREGFTVTYFLHDIRQADICSIGFMSNTVMEDVKISNTENETASAGEIDALAEKLNYRIIIFSREVGTLGKYAGTVHVLLQKIPDQSPANTSPKAEILADP
jgi:hypothetical protein